MNIEAKLEKWYNLNEELAKIKEQEQTLRREIFEEAFSSPKEGTNTFKLADGWALKGKYVINRTVDNAAFQSIVDELAEAGIPTGDIVQYKPSLVTKVYKDLSDEQRHLMDTVLIIKEGMPGLEIVKPKRG